MRRRTDDVLELAGGSLGLVDPVRRLGQAKRDELCAELVEVTGEGRLLGDLAERSDGDGVANVSAVGDGHAAIVDDEPRARRLDGAECEDVPPFAGSDLDREHADGRACVVGGDGAGNSLELIQEAHNCQDTSMASRKEHALELFQPLGSSYHRMGALLSFGQDPRWRRFLVDRVPRDGGRVLDVATGTGLVAERLLAAGHPVVGLDQSADMLAVARNRLSGRMELVEGSADELPFADEEFAHLTFTYLLRYVDDPAATLRELARVVRPGGTIAMLEFAVPQGVWRPLWDLHCRVGLPGIGRLASPGWCEVGRFLGPSIRDFHAAWPQQRLEDAWRQAGVADVATRRLSLGGAIVMWGTRTA